MKGSYKYMRTNNNNELLIKNEVIDMNKIEMSKNAKLVFYTALREKALKQIGSELNSSVVINHKQIKQIFKGNKSFNEIIKTIQNIPKEFKVVNGNIIDCVSMFEKYTINKYTKEINFKFTEEALKYFDISNGNFAKIMLDELYCMKSDYSIRMYEFACRYSGKIKMKIDTFKNYFNIPDSYDMYEIKRRVFKTSIKEVNNKTRFTLKTKEYKAGKTVTHIEIEVIENKVGVVNE
jgi:plasmid replication initiation protein